MLRWLAVPLLLLALSAPARAQSTDDPLFSIDTPIGPVDYVVGRGLSLGQTGLHIGGFSTLEIDREEGSAGTVELDSINFLIRWEPVDFLQGFAELEVGDLIAWETSGDTQSDPSASFERLYAELSRSDALHFRIGKFQTPVGIWNLVPAEPFTWTANEPILVEAAFDEHQTGAALHGSLFPGERRLEYWAYGQFIDPLYPSSDPEPADKSAGGRLRYGDALGRWAFGSSFLASKVDGEWSFLTGLDATAQLGPLELQGEWAIGRGDNAERRLWGAYLQGVYDLGVHADCLSGLRLVARYEHFDPSGPVRHSNVGNVGITWSPTRFLVIKAGYQFADHETDFVSRGLFTSLSVLF